MDQQRKDMLQSAGTLIALVISVIAMITSIYEANILEEQQKSMVWIYDSKEDSHKEGKFKAKLDYKN